jgi:hypothetical protein
MVLKLRFEDLAETEAFQGRHRETISQRLEQPPAQDSFKQW